MHRLRGNIHLFLSSQHLMGLILGGHPEADFKSTLTPLTRKMMQGWEEMGTHSGICLMGHCLIITHLYHIYLLMSIHFVTFPHTASWFLSEITCLRAFHSPKCLSP